MTSHKGKVIAITGAASGIGLKTAHLLASRGASLSLVDNRQEPLEAAVAAIKESNPNVKVHHKTVNVSKSSEVDEWLDGTVREYSGLHGAVNLAGMIGTTAQKKVQDVTDEDWESLMGVNLDGVFYCLRAELRHMGEGASIVSASSVAGLKGYATGGPYSTSKHGVIGLSKCAAIEEGHRNIRINCIAPGPIDTPMIQELNSRVQGQVIGGDQLAIKRSGTPDEVAKLISFLLSDESTYITGSVHSIDGGYLA